MQYAVRSMQEDFYNCHVVRTQWLVNTSLCRSAIVCKGEERAVVPSNDNSSNEKKPVVPSCVTRQ